MTGRNEPLQHILQEIMLEESTPSYAALVRWCERYPRHREALEDFFAVWAVQAELPERSTIALGNGDPESGAIRVNDLPEWLRPAVEPTAEAEITPERFFRALDQAQQNRTKAARILGMSRAQFYRLMKKFAGK